jgi:alpha-tubulin suppressor-like RCC1 family protein
MTVGLRHRSIRVTIAAFVALVIATVPALAVSAAKVPSTGSVWSWGGNFYGELGSSSPTERYLPQFVSKLTGVTSASAGGYFALALKGGRVLSWGENDHGELGLGRFTTTGCSCIPHPSTIGTIKGVTSVSAGYYHALAANKSGHVLAWGSDDFGELGRVVTYNGHCTCSAVPVVVPGVSAVRAVAAGSYFSLALTRDGRVWGWGENTWGQLGNGTTGYSSTPTPVHGLRNVVAIAAGDSHALALRANGSVWSWGLDTDGQLGTGTDCGAHQCFSWTATRVIGLPHVAVISAGAQNSAAIDSSGHLFIWGDNGSGELAQGTSCQQDGSGCISDLPVRVNGLPKLMAVSIGSNLAYADQTHVVALGVDHSVWAWGENLDEEAGDPSASAVLRPMLIDTLDDEAIGIGTGADDSFVIRSSKL